MKFTVDVIFNGFPGKSSRGFLGWSSVYLITIEESILGNKKYLLFDTGGFNERLELLKRLKILGLTPSDIDGVFLSHLHYDHCLNWTLFNNAKIFVSEKELQVDEQLPDLLIPEFHIEKLKNSQNLCIVNENDIIFGFNVVSLPGHTEGLIGLMRESIYFVSDAIKNRSELTSGDFLNVIDRDNAKKTVEKIKRNATVIYPGHDMKLVKNNGFWDVEETNTEIVYINNDFKDFNYGIKLNIK